MSKLLDTPSEYVYMYFSLSRAQILIEEYESFELVQQKTFRQSHRCEK